MSLKGKKIVFAVTGSIAAYKTPNLVRLLIKEGAEVKVILTNSAAEFVSPLSLSTVSKNPVLTNVSDGAAWNNHVELGIWADILLIAPCTANTLAKISIGICDNLVCAVYLSARCPVFIAPAMDEDMWKHPATKDNLQKCIDYGNKIISVGFGELASGLTGAGRMAEPEEIVAEIDHFFSEGNKPLNGKKALVTAGPTYELIDPVRFIGNFSTGKMGIAIAEALADAGARVSLILGPTSHQTSHQQIKVIDVVCAQEMFDATIKEFALADIAVLSAAVADYSPANKATDKLKKDSEELSITLIKTKDILKSLGEIKQPKQTLVGFALETNNEQENAKRKLVEKKADMIVLNSLRDEGAGFGHDTNKVTFLTRTGEVISVPLQSKKGVAKTIIDKIIEIQNAKENIS